MNDHDQQRIFSAMLESRTTLDHYRPMGAVQPAIYGPTAEMVEAMMAQMP